MKRKVINFINYNDGRKEVLEEIKEFLEEQEYKDFNLVIELEEN